MEEVRINLRGVINARVSDLNPFQEDIKVLTDENYLLMKEEILKDGFSFSPHVFIDGDNKLWILDGHQRKTCLDRMAEEGYEIPTIPCMEVEAESLEHARRLVLAAASQYGTFKPMKVVEFSKKIGITPINALERFTFPTVKFEKLVNVSGHVRSLAEPFEKELPKEPRTKLGDLIRLGEHLLYCGDATEKDSHATFLPYKQPDITFTSPPYNAATNMGADGVKKMYEHFKDDVDSNEYVEKMSKVLDLCLGYSKSFVFWNVNYNGNSRSEFIKQIVPYLDLLEETICWHKKIAMPVKHGLTRRWEPIFVFKTTQNKNRLAYGSEEQNVWDITGLSEQSKFHSAAFPEELPMKALELTGARTVLDPFGGTGSTLIAAEKLKRTCYMIELSTSYCDLIVSRWEELTGKKAVYLNQEPT